MATEQNKLYRYPGTKPFEAADYTLFKGRDEDIKNLFDFVFMENPVVLFSRSGLGKSSLLNAGLAKKITDENRATPLFIRFGAYTKETKVLPLERLKEEILKATEQKQNTLFEKLASQIQLEQNTLWYGFKHIQINDRGKHCFALIFDQFEELFTYPQDVVESFKRELSELMYTKVPQQLRDFISEKRKNDSNYFTKEEAELIFTRLDIRILFAIRSDKLSLLNSLTDVFPTVLKYCYELKPLSSEQAKQAILSPAQLTGDNFESPPFAFTEDALSHILNSLTGTTDAAKTGLTLEKPEIETFQLQIVCKYAENLVIEKGLKEITKQDLGDIKHIFEDQYNNIISKLPQQQQLPARLMMEDKLIVEQTRVSMPVISLLKDFEKQGMTKQLIDDLINTHIIRRDQSGAIEISHDTLVAPILKAKKEREDKEEITRLEAERQEDLRQQRTKVENEKIKLAITRRRTRKFIMISVGVLMLILIGSTIFTIKINEERKKAENASQMAAEQKLINDSIRIVADHEKDRAMANADSAQMLRARAEELLLKANEQTRKAAIAKKEAFLQKNLAIQMSIIANTSRRLADSALDQNIEIRRMVVGKKQGGIIFYVDPNREHGLIAAEKDLDSFYTWEAAKKACENYTVVVDGVTYDDWFFPSKDTLDLLYNNKSSFDGLSDDYYWSSSELNDGKNKAWCQYFGSADAYPGSQIEDSKSYRHRVRPVRAF
ncbi:MAG TPA: hypothetical protein PLP23_07880 [Panacibacter sp.]|nr:hypothetical protein [Panacibacter sp.]